MPDEQNKDEGFVSRWSRRKQQVATEEQHKVSPESTELGSEITDELIDPEQVKAEKLEALNKLSDEDMPDIETLNEDSDFSGFMSKNVSEGLRKIALRKLFSAKSYNICDGLDDYDDDYTKFAKMPSSMVTSDMKHMVEVEAKKQLAKEKLEAEQELIAASELDETDGIVDEVVDSSEEVPNESSNEETPEEYVDEHINVDGFDTTEIADNNDPVSSNNSNEHLNYDNNNEEVT